jgi:hypothetical protein
MKNFESENSIPTENLIPVEGHSDLFRDRETGAIVNTNAKAYKQYMRMKESKQNEKRELDMIKSDIGEIKLLLQEILKSR